MSSFKQKLLYNILAKSNRNAAFIGREIADTLRIRPEEITKKALIRNVGGAANMERICVRTSESCATSISSERPPMHADDLVTDDGRNGKAN